MSPVTMNQIPAANLRIAIVSGSVRPERLTHRLTEYLQHKLRTLGMESTVIDLARTPLPIFGDPSGNRAHIAEIGALLDESDALIFVTPEYHGTFSGALKNMLDHYSKEFVKKVIGVATTTTGKMGGINASTQLQHVILSLQAYPVPRKMLVSGIQHVFVEDGMVKDGTVKDDTVKDGIVKNGMVKNDMVKDGTVNYDTVKDASVEANANKFLEEFLWLATAVHRMSHLYYPGISHSGSFVGK